jgi:hypothetical protein
MATSSKHDHKNVGCHRINPPPRSGDRVLATTRTPAEIYKHRKEKPQPDGAGAKFVVSEAPSFFTRPFSSNAQRESMSASAGDFHPMLENSREPCGKRVERRWIEQEIRHHDEWHEDQQSIDPVPNGWRQWIR